MTGSDEDTEIRPGRMATAEPGPDYAVLDDGGGDAWAYRTPGTETRPFLVTSELVGAVAALAALAVTAASSDSLDARLAWPLATGIVAAYVFSRGFAKSRSPSFAWDPREALSRRGGNHRQKETHEMSTVQREEYGTRDSGMVVPGYGYGRGMRMGMGNPLPIETKPFFLTSEFWGSVALIAGLAIAAGTSEGIDARLFWMLTTAITIGYVISRGIAKSGTKSRSWDPRDDMMQGARERFTERQG